MTAPRSPQYRRSVRLVQRWCDVYLSELDPRVAGERREEIASDLYEHAVWADERGDSAGRLGRAIVGRAFRGAAADLSWRRAVLRASSSRGSSGPLRSLELVLVVGAVTSTLAAFGLFVVARTVLSLLRSDPVATLLPHGAAAAGTALLLAAVLMLVRPRRRALAAMALAAGTALLLPAAVTVLASTSATVSRFLSVSAVEVLQAEGVARLLVLGVALISAALVVAWWPASRRGVTDTARAAPTTDR